MSRPLLEIEDVKKDYDGQPVLKGISLNVYKGEVVVIIGPSGCGKSTLLRCINGLEDINGGRILLDGEVVDSKDSNLHLMRQKIGMVFQSYDLFPHLTVLDNLLLAPRIVSRRNREEAKEEAYRLLDMVGLRDHANKYPRQLSGGQKQRVAIARALIMHPEVMLFDEVTAALDPEMVREVLETILDLAEQGQTMLMVTHEMAFARAAADRIVFMDEGRIVEEGKPEEFFTHPTTERARKFLESFDYKRRRTKDDSKEEF